jgi:hypothetical protein
MVGIWGCSLYNFIVHLENIYNTRRAHAVILATQEAEIRRIGVQSQPGQIVCETLSQKKKSLHKKGLVEWLKRQALSSSLNMKKKKKKGKPGIAMPTSYLTQGYLGH